MKKRSVTIAGHRTSVSLEEPFWKALCELAEQRQTPLARIISEIDTGRSKINLSSAIRVYILELCRKNLLK